MNTLNDLRQEISELVDQMMDIQNQLEEMKEEEDSPMRLENLEPRTYFRFINPDTSEPTPTARTHFLVVNGIYTLWGDKVAYRTIAPGSTEWKAIVKPIKGITIQC